MSGILKKDAAVSGSNQGARSPLMIADSHRCGKTQTPISPSSNKPERNTRGFARPVQCGLTRVPRTNSLVPACSGSASGQANLASLSPDNAGRDSW